MNAPRIICDAALAVSVLFLPWWATAALALVFVFAFDRYVEALVAGFFMDSLYGAPVARLRGIEFAATLAAAAMLLLALYAKSRLRYYR